MLVPYYDPVFEKKEFEPVPVNLTANCSYDILNNYDNEAPFLMVDLLKHYANYKHIRNKFAAAMGRLDFPRATMLCNNSGKTVCVGADSASKARFAFQMQRHLIENIPHPTKPLEPKYLAQQCGMTICNFVVNVFLDYPIDLGKFAKAHPMHASYAPEIFPGLIYKTEFPLPVVVNVFDSGQLNITRCRDLEHVYHFLPEFKHKSSQCRADFSTTQNKHQFRLQNYYGPAYFEKFGCV